MKLAFISPVEALDISKLGDIEFCLAPFCTDNTYITYFKNQAKKGRYIIIDNGIAEDNLISNDKLVQTAISIKAGEIIVPDKIGDYNQTKQMRENFLNEYYPILKKNNIKIQSVIQGSTLFEYITCLEELLKDSRINVIGIPFRIHYFDLKNSTKEESQMWNRIQFILMNQKIINKPIHFLGNNLPQELLLIKKFNLNIRSCDSKLMARYGLNNKIFNIEDLEKPKKKLFIHSKMEPKLIKVAKLNINKLRGILNDR